MANPNTTVGAWPPAERPRERLLTHGAASLTDAELLAVLLRTGASGVSALDIARDLLGRFRNLASVLAAPGKVLAECRGLGPAKITQLKVAIELARRVLAEEIRHGSALTSPEAFMATPVLHDRR
jgi:DNA repair protein RadC